MRELLVATAVCLATTFGFAQVPSWETVVQAASPEVEVAQALVVDELNQFVYVAGFIDDSLAFPSLSNTHLNAGDGGGSTDGVLVKYDFSGNLIWVVNMGGTKEDEVTGVEVDDLGNVYVTGYFEDSIRFTSLSAPFSGLSHQGNDLDIFVAAYDPTGNLLWARQGGGVDVDRADAIAANGNGIYVTGYYTEAATFGSLTTESTFNNSSNGFLVKYDFSGNEKWLIEMKSPDDDLQGGTVREQAAALATDDSTIFIHVFFSGDSLLFTDTSGTLLNSPSPQNPLNISHLIASIRDQDGSVKWGVSIPEPSGNVFGMGIDTDCDGVYITGSLHGDAIMPSGAIVNPDNHDYPFLASLSQDDGIEQWLKIFPVSSSHDNIIHDVFADGFGNLYLTGNFAADTMFLPDTSLAITNSSDLFVARYTNDSTFRWARKVGGQSNQFGYAIGGYQRELLFVAGEYEDEAHFTPDSLVGLGKNEWFMGTLRVNSDLGSLTNCCPVPVLAGTASVSRNTICEGDTLNLRLDGSSGNIQWQSSTDGGANWNGIPGGTSDVFVFDPAENSWFRAVVEYSTCGTDTSEVLNVIVESSDGIVNAGPDQTLCGNTRISLQGNDPSPGTGYWNVISGGGEVLSETNPASVIQGLSNGLNQFEWVVSKGKCLNFRDTVNLFLDPDLANANAGTDQEVYFGDEAILTGNDPGPGTGEWRSVSGEGVFSSPMDSITEVTGLAGGENIFQWRINLPGCTVTDEVRIYRNLFEPKRIFTPGNDGYNDRFEIPGLERFPGTHITIFNRWGIQLFESADYQNDWDGKNASGDDLPVDTYY